MLNNWIRILYNDNGTFTDYSLDNSNTSATFTAALVNDEDYIYIGKYYPFNNFYLQVDTANTNAATLNIDIYDGTSWRSCVDILDGTSSGGKTLAQSGIIHFEPNKNYGWQRIADSSDSYAPTEMQDEVTIYNLYWMRFKVSADLSAGTLIKRIIYSFSNDANLLAYETKINNYLTAFGLSNWNDKIVTASQEVLNYLRAMEIIVNEGQIIRFEDVLIPTTYKTLSVIYNDLGKSYEDKRDYYENKFKETMVLPNMTIDSNMNGKLDIGELNTKEQVRIR